MLTRLIPLLGVPLGHRLARLLGVPLGHRLARLTGMADLHSMFCPCAPCGETDDLW